jgi:hypothetical protein
LLTRPNCVFSKPCSPALMAGFYCLDAGTRFSATMSFSKSTVSPPCIVEPGSCQAEHIHGGLARPLDRVPVTPEWLAENDAKQRAYETRRREWRRLWHRHEQNFADDGC